MDQDAAGYGLWLLAAANAAVFIMFAFSFARPETKRDWRSFGAFSAFVVALFAEMYGFPLTIYFLSGWLQARYPDFDFLSHDAGHLWSTLFGLTGDPHLSLSPHPFEFFHCRRIHRHRDRMARSARGAEKRGTRGDRSLCPGPPSAIRRVPDDFDGLSSAMANHSYARHVSDPRCHVCPFGSSRGGRSEA